MKDKTILLSLVKSFQIVMKSNLRQSECKAFYFNGTKRGSFSLLLIKLIVAFNFLNNSQFIFQLQNLALAWTIQFQMGMLGISSWFVQSTICVSTGADVILYLIACKRL